MKLCVLGAGAWGTALAIHASRQRQHGVTLWARDPAQAASMQGARRNLRYLESVAFPPALRVESDFDAALAQTQGGLLVVATPMAGLETALQALQRACPPASGVFWLSKGLQAGSGRLGHELAAAVAPDLRVGVLSGPSFALEVAREQPTALVAASIDAALCAQAVAALHNDSLRVYTSADPIGVEVGGAVKNVLAIATGIADAMPSGAGLIGLGMNARAALITRGLAEMTRLGVALGGRAETFRGLSGLGDLVLTATGSLSRNRQVGLLLAQGQQLAQILADIGHVAEGVSSAAVLLQRARGCAVEMPIVEAVVDVLEGRCTPAQALGVLMRRDARAEH